MPPRVGFYRYVPVKSSSLALLNNNNKLFNVWPCIYNVLHIRSILHSQFDAFYNADCLPVLLTGKHHLIRSSPEIVPRCMYMNAVNRIQSIRHRGE